MLLIPPYIIKFKFKFYTIMFSYISNLLYQNDRVPTICVFIYQNDKVPTFIFFILE